MGTKEGYLLKGPEIGSDRIFSNLASKSFKKRFCSMVREADGTYILEVYKDEKKTDTKLTIVMDFCSDVVKVLIFVFLVIFCAENKKKNLSKVRTKVNDKPLESKTNRKFHIHYICVLRFYMFK